jgi:hypothetical protein
LGLLNEVFPSGFPMKILYALLITSIYATCLAHLKILDFITLIILGAEYKLWSSSLCIFLQHPLKINNEIRQLENLITITELQNFHSWITYVCPVVVVFADKFMTQKLMDAAARHGVIGRFVWLLCDAWSAPSGHRNPDIAFNHRIISNGKII